eukprot:scaffold243899_cov37-Tisochrysis_lutea.AAC.2
MAARERSVAEAKARLRDQQAELRARRERKSQEIRDKVEQIAREEATRRREALERIEKQRQQDAICNTLRNEALWQRQQQALPSRILFNDRHCLKEAISVPGPYDIKSTIGTGEVSPSFGPHPTIKTLKKPPETTPGPGEYVPRVPSSVSFSFLARLEHGGPLQVRAPDAPGPGAYDVPGFVGRLNGGRLYVQPTCTYDLRSEVDIALYRSADIPGPGEYSPQSLPGKGKSLGGRLSPSKRRDRIVSMEPGPSSYSLPEKSLRGGYVSMVPHKHKLTAVSPGPAEYYLTRTAAEDKDLRRLSRDLARTSNEELGWSSEASSTSSSPTRIKPGLGASKSMGRLPPMSWERGC